MAGLVLGPLLRYTGSTQAKVWVGTDAPCEVQVRKLRIEVQPKAVQVCVPASG
jgi:hypothetical protein